MEHLTIRRYENSDREIWNEFVRNSRNGNFLFNRNYMEYHVDRFPDCSFLFFRGEKLCAVIPGTIDGEKIFSSHAGLTFGGFILDDFARASDVQILFELLDAELKNLGAQKVRYKPLPWIYAKFPSQEDLYWLFRKKATLRSRLLSTALMPKLAQMSSQKRRYFHRSERSGLKFSESPDWENFWLVLDSCLQSRHEAHPVHSAAELKLLALRFPKNIRLFTVSDSEGILSGAVIYESENVAHAQYLASSAKGRAVHAMDFLMLSLVQKFGEKRFVDWGTSNENGGLILNEGLIRQKEECGGHGVAYDTYEYEL